MKLTYRHCGDYLLPDLTIPDEPVALGKYGRNFSFSGTLRFAAWSSRFRFFQKLADHRTVSFLSVGSE